MDDVDPHSFLTHNSIPMSVLLAVAAIIAALYLVYFARARNAGSRLPLPPGPPGNWDITSLSSLTSLENLESLVEEYGPVFTLHSGSKVAVIIGRRQAAVDIMEKEGAALADRPRWTAASEIVSGGMRLLLLQSGERLRKFRKALHTHLHAKSAKDYEPLQMHYAANLVRKIAENPAKHMDYAKEYAASFVLSLAYGRTGSVDVSDSEIVAIQRSLKRVGTAVRPGAYMVDDYPSLRYLPFYHPELRSWHAEELSLYRNQVAGVKDSMDTVQPCFSKYLLENQAKLRLNHDEVVYLAGTMFGAGSTTTASAISVVIMAAACFPHMQAWVQEELDAVVGCKRVPTFDDYVDLPRVLAFVLESYRWRPVGGSGFAHRASRDIIWRNYCIPKDAIVIGDHWSICRDPSVFANPEVFDPTRWFDENGSLRSDASLFSFGFGRRVCPGRYVADRSLFITTALLLWAFRISEDEKAPIDQRGFGGEGISITPDAFGVCFEKRVENMGELLE
ncbi:cytochrome P450 [Desarmillaria tabescens]|uniref:Cytochrome P450 n=1 Tax=Armillaria tabescens TaxID=1929756 RepID=A0AA39MQW1_ARMTA|nr:cytochrome P450 [Desarmillaria tabescens]KAK0442714.1 cytochrome P450 [Desarmillaria tabescens]